MDPLQALAFIDQAVAQAPLSRDHTFRVMEALAVVRQALTPPEQSPELAAPTE